MKTHVFLPLFLLLPFFVFSQSPGGVGTTNLKLWNKANAGVATSGSNVTSWTDQTATNTFTVTGSPALQSSALNYNPTVSFDGSSYFTGNTAINNITQAFVVGKINSSGGAMIGTSPFFSAGSRYFFHTESNRLYCAGQALAVYTWFDNGSNIVPYSIMSEDLSKTPTASDVIRINGTNKTNSGGDPAVIARDTPILGARLLTSSVEGLPAGSEMAEAILFDASLSATNVNKVESYLAIKYGITLSTSYINSAGTTIYNVSSYANNVIGIARDDNSGLLQKQSHQSNDATRIYLSTLQTTNAANSGSFSGNAQFVVMGNDNNSLSFGSSSEYPSGLQIQSRIGREWKITNTGFTGTFSIDITPAAGAYNASLLRVLIDTDGDFTNATVITPTVSYSSGDITISGITTTMLPAGATRFMTIVQLAPTPGGAGAAKLWLKADGNVYSDAGSTPVANGGNVQQWSDNTTNALHVSQTVAADKPVFRNGSAHSFNYNPVVDFTDDELVTNNSGNGVFPAGTYNHVNIYTVYQDRDANNFDWLYYQGGDYTNRVSLSFNYGANTAADFDVPSPGNRLSASTVTDIPVNTVNIVGFNSGTTATYGQSSNRNQALMVNGKEIVSDNAYTAYNGFNDEFHIGDQTINGNDAPYNPFGGYVGEMIVFQGSLSYNQRVQVESYLAVKYGKTLDNSAGGTDGDYLSSAGTTIWDASDNSTYHQQVTGIGRDDNSALLQKQSHTGDDTTRMYLSTLQTTNAGNSGSFGNNVSYIVNGNNGGLMVTTGSAEYPAAQNIYARLDREWKITNTNFPGTFSMDVTFKTLSGSTSELQLLVDDDGDFSNASVYTPAITSSGNVVTVSDINTTMIPSGSTRYITLAYVSSAQTILPVSLTGFTAKPQGAAVQLNWETASEYNNAYFAIERSADGIHWQQIGKVPGAGASAQLLTYSYADTYPLNGTSYYRLIQTDVDGTAKQSPIRAVQWRRDVRSVQVYPNPVVNNQVFINAAVTTELRVYDVLGRDVTTQMKVISRGETQTVVNMGTVPEGLYIFRINDSLHKILKK